MQTHEWEALLSECADSWELGDTYADGPRQLLEDGSVIGTIAMHISQHEEVVAAAPSAVAEVIRLRREIESLRGDCYQTLNDPHVEGMTPNSAAHHVALDCFARLTRILEGETNE